MQKPSDYIAAARYGNALGALRTQGKTLMFLNRLAKRTSLSKGDASDFIDETINR